MVAPERLAVVFPQCVGAVARGDAGLRFFGEIPLGATVWAVIIAQNGREVVFQVGGRQVEGRSDLEFLPGTVVALRLIEVSGERIVFRVESGREAEVASAPAGADATEAARLRGLERGIGARFEELQSSLGKLPHDAAAAAGAREVGGELLRLLESLCVDPERPGEWVAARIAEFVRDGGIHYEKKCGEFAETGTPDRLALLRRDLKFQVQRVLEELEGDGGAGRDEGRRRSVPGPVRAASDLLRNIVAQQVLNLKRERLSGDGLSWYFQIPVRTPGGLLTAEVAVYRRGDGQGHGSPGEWGDEIVLRLQTATLGELVVLLRMRGVEVSVQFRVRDEGVRARVQQGLDELRGGLAAAGLSVRGMDCLCAGGPRASAGLGGSAWVEARSVGIDILV